MDEQTLLAELLVQVTQIKWIFTSILVLIGLGVIGVVVLVLMAKKGMKEKMSNDSFRDDVSALLDKDDLDAVIKKCEEKLEGYPKELHAHWYLAQAYYRKGNYHKALASLNLISENAPSWKEDFVDPYVDEIKEKLENTKPEVVK